MVMWVMSDRAIPRSYRDDGRLRSHVPPHRLPRGGLRLVKFHWRPLAGIQSLVWDEAQSWPAGPRLPPP